jgi:DNA replication and repair protein RecF
LLKAIKQGRGDVRTLDVWDDQLAMVGAELLAGRRYLVHLLAPHVNHAYQEVSAGQGQAHLEYRSGLGQAVLVDPQPGRDTLRAHLIEAIARRRPVEIERQVSLVGPHRDDLQLNLGELPARGFASHGESWSYALALRLASYQLLRADTGTDGDGEPVLILDDVFAELDSGRRHRLAALVKEAEQVLVTAAVPEDVPVTLDGAWVEVSGGEVRRAG